MTGLAEIYGLAGRESDGMNGIAVDIGDGKVQLRDDVHAEEEMTIDKRFHCHYANAI